MSIIFNDLEISMKRIVATLMFAWIAVTTGGAAAQDATKTNEPAGKDGMMKKDAMTMQECKDHMAMGMKDGMTKDSATMKKDTMCADMMKKDGMMKGDTTMKKDGTSSEPMKK
jgi:hypothetical protein